MLDTIRQLSVAIGPRPPASQAEWRAADWCAGQLRSLGFETRLQLFPGVPTFTSYVAPLYGAGSLASVALARGWHRVAALLAIPATVTFYREQTYRPTLSTYVPRRPSTNVVAYHPARRDRRQTVLLVAHLDTQHAALPFHPRLVTGFRQSYLVVTVGLVWTALLSLWRLLRPVDKPGWPERLGTLLSLNAVVSVLMLLHRHLFLPHVDGANDNASGVAVVLAAAEALADTLAYTDLWIVLTGSEETGSHGMLHVLDTHSFDPHSTYVINCDTCGAGRVTVVDREGPLKVYRADPTLVAAARRVIARDGLDVSVQPYHLLGTDAEAAMEHGYRSLSVMAMDERGLLPNWHWTTDTAEHIEPATLETARRLVVALVETLDERCRS